MTERESGAPAPEIHTTITGEDWYGRDISGQEHANVLFVDLDMTEVSNRGGIFTECTFRRARFNVSLHEDAAFVNCTFEGCAFFGTRMRDADLAGAHCHGSSLRNVDLSGAWLHNIDFTECDLRGSDLSALDPESAKLHGAIITLEQTVTVSQVLGLDVRAE